MLSFFFFNQVAFQPENCYHCAEVIFWDLRSAHETTMLSQDQFSVLEEPAEGAHSITTLGSDTRLTLSLSRPPGITHAPRVYRMAMDFATVCQRLHL